MAVLTGVAGLVLALTGCSVAVPGAGTRLAAATGAASTPTSPSTPAATRNPALLLSAARDGLAHVFGFEATGTLVLGVQKVTIDVTVGPGGGHGTITAAGVTAVLDFNELSAPSGGSGLYVTAPVTYWLRQGFGQDDAARYADQQVSIPTTSALASGRALVDQEALAQLVFTAAGTLSSPTVKDSPAVDGQPAVVVDFGGDHRTRMTLMATGQQFPLRLVSPSATLTFGKFGIDPKVTTPSGTPLSLPS